MSDKKLDKIKFNHWLNVRKMSIDYLNSLMGKNVNYEISLDNLDTVDVNVIIKIAEILSVPEDYLLENSDVPSFVYKSKEQIERSKRPINRGGIHYYNYYTLPSPKGYVAPVIIDILCPKEKAPILNNGHLEPAITVSLGPNDIYARFDKKINKTTFLKFKINPDPKTNWVVGSNYFEPSYCLHTYSRATEGPGKILSYTTKSYIENLLDNKLNEDSFKNLGKNLTKKKPNRNFLEQDMLNKGYSHEEISKKSKISLKKIKDHFKDKGKGLSEKEIKKICNILNSEATIYFDKKFTEDKIGKNYFDYKDSIKTIRKFKSYKVASIANSSRAPDLTGYFIKVENNSKKSLLDLMDNNCSHYLVTKGKLTFYCEINKKINDIAMEEGDSIWVSALNKHGFTGAGALIKISDGQNFNYLEKIDLMNTYNLSKTLSRGRKNKLNWGYDVKK